MSNIKKTKPASPKLTSQNTYPAGTSRERILNAAFSLFAESGLMRVRKAPTEREIQTRARAATETLFCRFP